ncbi:MAG: hypothetical protein ACJ8J7_13195 [Sulfurifustaceae bacterium]
MRQVMVRYKVKADRAEENERYIAAVFEQLKREHLPQVHYASFKLEDGVSFVHIASFETDDSNRALRELPTFKAYLEGISDRCQEQPVISTMREVGTYQFFGR